MSEKPGQIPIENLVDTSKNLTITVEVDWKGEKISVTPDVKTNVATLLYVLSVAYSSVIETASDKVGVDNASGPVLH